MKKRIYFLILTIIFIFAFTFTSFASDFNTFTFISNLQYSEQTHFPDNISYTLPLTSSDEFISTNTYGGRQLTYNFMGYSLYLRGFNKVSGDNTSYTEVNIPIRVNIPQGGCIQIPILLCGNQDQSLSLTFNGSFCTLGLQEIPFKLTTDGTTSPTLSYINNVYDNYLNITVPYDSQVYTFNKCQLLMVNIYNTRDTDMFCRGFTLRYNRSVSTPEFIVFPMIYEGDDLIFYYPPNPYNIPILKEINDTLDIIISKLVSGDNSVADLLDDVISKIDSLDSNIGSIDSNIIEIVEQLNYLSTISTTNRSIYSTLTAIRSMLSDLTENTQNLPSQLFDQIIEDNSEYIDNQKDTTVNRYNDANEQKNDIYTSSSSGLTSSGGTYDYVADLVADAGSDQGFNGIFGLIFGNSNISGIILSVIALGTISYILYGKRG